MRDRRSLLCGLAALPLAGLVPATALAAEADPIVGLYRKAMSLTAHANDPATSHDEVDQTFGEVIGLQEDAFDLRATTPAGALASLEWARQEFARYYVNESQGQPIDWMDRFTLNMIDSALGVLRQAVEGGARV